MRDHPAIVQDDSASPVVTLYGDEFTVPERGRASEESPPLDVDVPLQQEPVRAMLPFPYGGEGDILVAGNLAKDQSTFFAKAILSYKPTTSRRKLKIRLRSLEFLPDRLTVVLTRAFEHEFSDASIVVTFSRTP